MTDFQKARVIRLLLVPALSAGFLQAREPAWIFNNGPDAKLISLGQVSFATRPD
jgi:hypothetical protein